MSTGYHEGKNTGGHEGGRHEYRGPGRTGDYEGMEGVSTGGHGGKECMSTGGHGGGRECMSTMKGGVCEAMSFEGCTNKSVFIFMIL